MHTLPCGYGFNSHENRNEHAIATVQRRILVWPRDTGRALGKSGLQTMMQRQTRPGRNGQGGPGTSAVQTPTSLHFTSLHRRISQERLLIKPLQKMTIASDIYQCDT